MLRHYDELDLFKPSYVDPATEYRYYTIEQLPHLHQILALKDLGLSLEKIAELLQKGLPREQLQQMLQTKQRDLQHNIKEAQARLNRLAGRLQQLEQEGQASPYDVVVKPVPTYCVASARHCVPTVADMPEYRGMLIRQLYAWLNEHRLVSTGHEMVFYHIPEYVETDIDMEFAIAVPDTTPLTHSTPQDSVVVRQVPGVNQVASVIHSGMMHDVTQAIAALFTWIGMNGYTSSGSIREIHLFGPETIRVREEPIVLEVQIPIEPLLGKSGI